MPAELLLQQNTARQIKNLLRDPPSAILVTGQPGSGKDTLACYLAANLLSANLSQLDSHPGLIRIAKPDDKKEIPIESVRELNKKLSLRTFPNQKSGVSRLIYIEDAHLMSGEAQNALLKMLEEPPEQTVFILSALSQKAVLPTIASRTQRITVNPVSLNEAVKYFAAEYSEDKVKSAWSLSQGTPGLMAAALADDTGHPLKQAVDASKKFLRMNQYERLLFLDSIGSRQELDEFLDGLGRVLRELSQISITSDKNSQATKLVAARRMVSTARRSLDRNSSVRLVCLNLGLNLPI